MHIIIQLLLLSLCTFTPPSSFCISCGASLKVGRPQQTAEKDGFRVSHSGGGPINRSREAGYCVSGGRPRGTRQQVEFHNSIALPAY